MWINKKTFENYGIPCEHLSEHFQMHISLNEKKYPNYIVPEEEMKQFLTYIMDSVLSIDLAKCKPIKYFDEHSPRINMHDLGKFKWKWYRYLILSWLHDKIYYRIRNL